MSYEEEEDTCHMRRATAKHRERERERERERARARERERESDIDVCEGEREIFSSSDYHFKMIIFYHFIFMM